MKSPCGSCARTNAVLAVHLDGDFTTDELAPTGAASPEHRAEWGWDFVSGESLREHLAACAICQRALQRARRLDAALAADAGRAVADLLVRGPGEPPRSLEDLGRDLVARAMRHADGATAGATAITFAGARDGARGEGAGETVGDEAATDEHGVHRDAARQGSAAPQPLRHASASASASATPSSSRGSSWFAATVLVAAAVMAWWLLLGDRTAARRPTRAVGATAANTATTNQPTPATDLIATPGTDDGETLFPLEAARRFARARGRDDTAERGPSPERLGATLIDRDATTSERITAGAQLTQLARSPARNARACTDALLRALAGCGDGNEAELEVQRTLLPELRTAPLTNVLVQRLQPLLADETDGPFADHAPDLDTIAALVVALRVGGDRLDAALRRVLRTRADLDPIVTQALRCPTRNDGGARFLLTCWQDRVAAGRQQDTSATALHWFAGMPPAAFATVREVLETSRSAPERVRCLLALGCVGDDSTAACLLTHLRSGRRIEACAASAALSTLPHSALRPLVPLARRTGARRSGDPRGGEEGLLRLALARAGLDEAAPWVAALDLTDRQREQLRDAPLTSFSEIAGWFREGATIAD